MRLPPMEVAPFAPRSAASTKDSLMADSTAHLESLIDEEFNRMRGRLCGLIESWGLPERQERGAINTLKTLSYDAQKVIKETVVDPPTQSRVERR